MLNPYAKALFKKTAKHLWRDLGKRHKYALNKAEVGITDDLVHLLSQYARKHPWSGIQVWRSKNEARNGHDIDLFIKSGGSRPGYYWFPLQAKVLYDTKRYESANHANPHGEQWALLKALRDKAAGTSGLFCAPYYLLYNGFSAKCRARYLKAHTPITHTVAAAWRSSLGCSLAEVDEFHTISTPSPPATTNKPLYHAVHNYRSLMVGGPVFPWHHLFKTKLVATKRRGLRLLTEQELMSRLSFYQNVVVPFAKTAAPTNYYYYYYYGFEDQPSNEGENLRGRYAVVISEADEMGRVFS